MAEDNLSISRQPSTVDFPSTRMLEKAKPPQTSKGSGTIQNVTTDVPKLPRPQRRKVKGIFAKIGQRQQEKLSKESNTAKTETTPKSPKRAKRKATDVLKELTNHRQGVLQKKARSTSSADEVDTPSVAVTVLDPKQDSSVRKNDSVAQKTLSIKDELVEEIETLKTSPKPNLSETEKLSQLMEKVRTQEKQLRKDIKKEGTAKVEYEGLTFTVVKTPEKLLKKGKLYVHLGGISKTDDKGKSRGGKLGEGTVKEVDLGIKVQNLNKELKFIAIGQVRSTIPTEAEKVQREKEMAREHKIGKKLRKMLGSGIFSSFATVQMGSKKSKKVAYIYRLSRGDCFIDTMGEGKVHELSLQKRKNNAKQLIDTMVKMHAKGYVHRDLKGDNVFLDKNNNACIADIGEIMHKTEYQSKEFLGERERVKNSIKILGDLSDLISNIESYPIMEKGAIDTINSFDQLTLFDQSTIEPLDPKAQQDLNNKSRLINFLQKEGILPPSTKEESASPRKKVERFESELKNLIENKDDLIATLKQNTSSKIKESQEKAIAYKKEAGLKADVTQHEIGSITADLRAKFGLMELSYEEQQIDDNRNICTVILDTFPEEERTDDLMEYLNKQFKKCGHKIQTSEGFNFEAQEGTDIKKKVTTINWNIRKA